MQSQEILTVLLIHTEPEKTGCKYFVACKLNEPQKKEKRNYEATF